MDKRVIKEHVCEKKDKMKHTAYSCRIWQQKDNVEAKQFADNLERQGYWRLWENTPTTNWSLKSTWQTDGTGIVWYLMEMLSTDFSHASRFHHT